MFSEETVANESVELDPSEVERVLGYTFLRSRSHAQRVYPPELLA